MNCTICEKNETQVSDYLKKNPLEYPIENRWNTVYYETYSNDSPDGTCHVCPICNFDKPEIVRDCSKINEAMYRDMNGY
jgi:hypothetical protein